MYITAGSGIKNKLIRLFLSYHHTRAFTNIVIYLICVNLNNQISIFIKMNKLTVFVAFVALFAIVFVHQTKAGDPMPGREMFENLKAQLKQFQNQMQKGINKGMNENAIPGQEGLGQAPSGGRLPFNPSKIFEPFTNMLKMFG